MTNKKTVFVLGAGASFEFGLPIGETLKVSISSLLNYKFDEGTLSGGDELILDALRAGAREEGKTRIADHLDAARKIANALPLAFSIDNFLHNHNNDENITLCGKLGIVRAILSAERISNLYVKDDARISFKKCVETWAVRLVKLITEQCSLNELEDRLSSLAFIVFNYDRCLEHFLAHAFEASYSITRQQAYELVNKMEIYHPYGIVGNLPWMTRRPAGVVGFGEIPHASKLLELVQGIKTFTEGTDPSDSDILAIRSRVAEAGRFVFLGYAYHPLNMDLLVRGAAKSKVTRRVFGTAYGMSKSDTEAIRDMLDTTLLAPSAAVRDDVTCFKLFHEYSRALSFT